MLQIVRSKEFEARFLSEAKNVVSCENVASQMLLTPPNSNSDLY
jgi:hypothetical protein